MGISSSVYKDFPLSTIDKMYFQTPFDIDTVPNASSPPSANEAIENVIHEVSRARKNLMDSYRYIFQHLSATHLEAALTASREHDDKVELLMKLSNLPGECNILYGLIVVYRKTPSQANLDKLLDY
jgi:hypothetical protein